MKDLLSSINTVIVNLLDKLTKLYYDLNCIEKRFVNSFTIQKTVNYFYKLAAQNNTAALDSYICENFPILLSGFELVQKKIHHISYEVIILKAATNINNSHDKDYENEVDDYFVS